LGTQAVLAKLRLKSDTIRDMISNNPTLIMKDGTFLRKAMVEKRVAETDVWSKLREANVCQLGEVRAVVLETTGDMTVLHGNELDPQILTGVDCTHAHHG
jgi:uncharacterized membrane protein YcaP (DUF421 family)